MHHSVLRLAGIDVAENPGNFSQSGSGTKYSFILSTVTTSSIETIAEITEGKM